MYRKYMDQFFQKNGILDQIGYSYRGQQHHFALEYGDYLDQAVKVTKPPIVIAEVGTGVGKTLVTGIGCGLIAKHDNKRSIVSTYTRALRDEMVDQEPIINSALNVLFPTLANHPVTFGAYRSYTTIASLKQANAVVDYYLTNMPNSPYLIDAIAFRDQIVQHQSNGQVFHIDDWLNHGTFDFYTLARGLADNKFISNLGMTAGQYTYQAKEGVNNPQYAAVTKFDVENRRAKNVYDVMLVTNTMFINNGKHLGRVLNTNSKTNNDSFHVVIDEADQFGHQATTVYDFNFKLSDIEDIYKMNNKRSLAIVLLKKYLSNKQSPIMMDKDISDLREFTTYVDALITEMIGKFDEKVYAGSPVNDVVNHFLVGLYKISDWVHTISDNSFEARAMDDAGLEIVIFRLKNDYRFVFEANSGRKIVNRSWQNYNTHNFESFIMMSGTILDGSKSDEPFKKLIGIGKNNNTYPPINIRTTGRAESLIFCKGPAKIWDDEDALIASENSSTTRQLNSEYLDHIKSVILAATKESPALILVNSYLDIERLRGLPGKFIFQNIGEKSYKFVQRLIASPDHSAVCLFWSGVNFVDNGKTIFHKLVIPRLPFKPAKTLSSKQWEYEKVKVEAFWKIRQGYGRLFRSPQDQHGEIWICDPRLKIPDGTRLKYQGGDTVLPGLFDPIIRDNGTTIAKVWENGTIVETSPII